MLIRTCATLTRNARISKIVSLIFVLIRNTFRARLLVKSKLRWRGEYQQFFDTVSRVCWCTNNVPGPLKKLARDPRGPPPGPLKSLKAATSGEKEVLRPLGPSKKQTEISLNVPLSRQTLLYLAGCTLYLAKRAVISPNMPLSRRLYPLSRQTCRYLAKCLRTRRGLISLVGELISDLWDLWDL